MRVRAVNAAGSGPWVHQTVTAGVPPTVSFLVGSISVYEGYTVGVRATLSKALATDVRIPITVSRVTAESSDLGYPPSSILISGGQTTGGISIGTNRDADDDDETFTVSLGTLPPTVTSGSPSSVTVTIVEDPRPTVSISATPNPVTEGDTVTVRATLSAALTDSVSFTFYVFGGAGRFGRFGPSEDGDFGPVPRPRRILIQSGETYGEVEIPTNRDADNGHEWFRVGLHSTPSTFPVARGSPSELRIGILDTTVATAVRLALDPSTVWENAGETDVEVTVSLNGTALSQDTEVSVARRAAMRCPGPITRPSRR